MARVNKNGNLSGAIGNLVFVNRDGKTHVRSKPKRVNQSTNTRSAATGFGKNSGHDSILREAITDKIQWSARYSITIGSGREPPISIPSIT